MGRGIEAVRSKSDQAETAAGAPPAPHGSVPFRTLERMFDVSSTSRVRRSWPGDFPDFRGRGALHGLECRFQHGARRTQGAVEFGEVLKRRRFLVSLCHVEQEARQHVMGAAAPVPFLVLVMREHQVRQHLGVIERGR